MADLQQEGLMVLFRPMPEPTAHLGAARNELSCMLDICDFLSTTALSHSTTIYTN
jgi:hypothetical protein